MLLDNRPKPSDQTAAFSTLERGRQGSTISEFRERSQDRCKIHIARPWHTRSTQLADYDKLGDKKGPDPMLDFILTSSSEMSETLQPASH